MSGVVGNSRRHVLSWQGSNTLNNTVRLASHWSNLNLYSTEYYIQKTNNLSLTAIFRMLEFVLKIGSRDQSHRCTQAESRNEGIIVDFSTDNEITWQPLKLVEPLLYNGTLEHVLLELPSEAKTDRTIFRWWQPLGYGGRWFVLLFSFIVIPLHDCLRYPSLGLPISAWWLSKLLKWGRRNIYVYRQLVKHWTGYNSTD